MLDNNYVFFEGTYITREEYNKWYEETYKDNEIYVADIETYIDADGNEVML